MKKKGDAEILSTILLLTLVVLVGAIVFIYAKKSTVDVLQSTEKLNTASGASQECSNIILKVSNCNCEYFNETYNSCKISILNDAPVEIKEVIYVLYQNNAFLNTGKTDINLPASGGYTINNILIGKNTYPTRVELKPTKVIFNNKEINCGNKVSMGGCLNV